MAVLQGFQIAWSVRTEWTTVAEQPRGRAPATPRQLSNADATRPIQVCTLTSPPLSAPVEPHPLPLVRFSPCCLSASSRTSNIRCYTLHSSACAHYALLLHLAQAALVTLACHLAALTLAPAHTTFTNTYSSGEHVTRSREGRRNEALRRAQHQKRLSLMLVTLPMPDVAVFRTGNSQLAPERTP